MNLRATANSVIQPINADKLVVVAIYTGMVTSDDYKQVAEYDNFSVKAQIQPIDSYKLQHLNNFVQGAVYRKFYVQMDIKGLSTAEQKGQDKIIDGEKVYNIVEQWESWSDSGKPWSSTIGILVQS